ncbi:helix-turn-helix transcriptional regulator [Paenibacillus sp. IB182496]|uniref:Helix-turn-helix transcriptional regulator n=1 Tax=Paenibacillus sabuli TaxID=2772509 RepID=A0A927BQQ9_9BACL|nr:AraC family transcriptional regulator [Paenibacillus sabuli]MBD2844025.1 helix-turn-helix transcriptional regulator [Paenibacillus sabuli]
MRRSAPLALSREPFQSAFRRSGGSEYKDITHLHEGIEVLYVERGAGQVVIEGRSVAVGSGTLLFFQPFQLHKLSMRPVGDARYIRSFFVYDPIWLHAYLAPFPQLAAFHLQLWKRQWTCQWLAGVDADHPLALALRQLGDEGGSEAIEAVRSRASDDDEGDARDDEDRGREAINSDAAGGDGAKDEDEAVGGEGQEDDRTRSSAGAGRGAAGGNVGYSGAGTTGGGETASSRTGAGGSAAAGEDQALFVAGFLGLLRRYLEDGSVAEHAVRRPDSHAERAMEWLNTHYDRPFRLGELAEHLHLTPAYVSALFRQEVGESVSDYLTARRIKAACHLLATSELPVGLVAERVGISNTSYFCRLFKRHMGESPHRFRRRLERDGGQGD